jgi:enoyl-CoA hydratase/carnithine racemase
MSSDDVLFEQDGPIATITLNRPDKMNALTAEMMYRLRDLWAQVREDERIWVAIITGAGDRAFSAGRDLMAAAPGGPEYHRINKDAGVSTEGVLDIFLPLEVPKPVIAAINGYCLAGGFALALACDLRLASENAKLGTSSTVRGLLAGGGQTERLVRYLPFGVALEMLFFSEQIEAHRLLHFGLVNAVFPQAELLPAARDWARRLCEVGPLAVRATKEAAYRGGLDMPFAEARKLEDKLYDLMLESEDVVEGQRAFAEKRPAVFRGR